ncbi:MAG: hypothetical protein KKC76_08980 [Proteobacteria bacterium]|nr:hypothetical protein [Pseudomonadota bacterium]MBU4297982.1 hypothetical protein [Pseudomonadota bacterium]MCG2749542.1 hypothetical protein [Desulfobulbaceae bacterium]
MRFILPLFLIMMLMPMPLRAEYFLKGRVIAVDREKGEITLSALNCIQSRPPRPGAETEKAEPPLEGGGIYTISTDFIPPCASLDHIIQVWGELSKEDENHLRARRITGPGWRHGKDSTGVRSRIRKRCFMKPPPPGPGEP